MGIFSRRKEQKIGENKSEQQKSVFDFASTKGKYPITIANIKELKQRIQHRGGEINKLILAKVLDYGNNGSFNMDKAKNILFEIPESWELDENMLQAVAQRYEEIQEQQKSREKCNYLGIVDYTQNGFEINKKSVAVEQYMQRTIIPQINQEDARRNQEIKTRKDEENNRRQQEEFKRELDARAFVAQEQQKRLQEVERRKRDAFLRQIPSSINGYEEYNGRNIENGDVLKLRQIQKVGKDKLGNYLYSGYIQSTENEYDEERLDNEEPFGFPVCFELPERLSDIVTRQDPKEIDRVLELFSDRQNFKSNDLQYIGNIDKTGIVQHGGMSKSSAINYKVQQLQQAFSEARKKSSQNEL